MNPKDKKPPRASAPPAFRPQPVPKVLQAKRQTPVAPPAYRPQATPKVLQRKSTPQAIQGHVRVTPPAAQLKHATPVAPPAYRPQPVPQVLQTKRAAGSLSPASLKTPQGPKHHGPMKPPVPPHRSPARPIVQRKVTRGAPPLGPRAAIQMAVDKKSKAFVPMDLQNACFSTVTAMLYVDTHGDGEYKPIGKFKSTKKGHAEEHILKYLRKKYYGALAQVIIELTTSPCGEDHHNCAGQLKKFMEDEAEEHGIATIKIKALGFYKGSRDAMYDAAELKSVDGMDFEVWDLEAESQLAGPAEGYDNYESLQNLALADIGQEPKSGRKYHPYLRAKHNQDKFAKFVLGE